MDKTKIKRVFSRKSMRNLAQYKDMSEDEFNEHFDKKELDLEPVRKFEERIQRKIRGFAEDYNLSDLKFNDHQMLRALAQALITLDDLETFSYKLREDGITDSNLNLMDKVSSQMSKIRTDISRMQDDLKISRKIRQSDKELTVIDELERLKIKAKKFYESKMSYIFCPTCKMLLMTCWALYPHAKNKIALTCNRELENKEVCDTKVVVTTKELMAYKGSNKPEFLPESLI